MLIYLIFLSFFRCVLGLFLASRIRIAQGNIFSGDIPLRSITQGAPPFVGPLPPLDLVASRPRPLAFLRPEPLQGWQYSWQVLRLAEPDLKLKGEVELLEIIREEVRVEHFFRPFRGNFKGKAYDSDMPPPVVIKSRPP